MVRIAYQKRKASDDRYRGVGGRLNYLSAFLGGAMAAKPEARLHDANDFDLDLLI